MNAKDMKRAVVPLVKELEKAIGDLLGNPQTFDIGQINDALLSASRFIQDPVAYIDEENRPKRETSKVQLPRVDPKKLGPAPLPESSYNRRMIP